MRKHEKLLATGITIAGLGMCCLDSDGKAFAVAVAVTIIGFLITAVGFRVGKRA